MLASNRDKALGIIPIFIVECRGEELLIRVIPSGISTFFVVMKRGIFYLLS